MKEYIELKVTLPKQTIVLGGCEDIVIDEPSSEIVYLHSRQGYDDNFKRKVINKLVTEMVHKLSVQEEFDEDRLMNEPKYRVTETFVPQKFKPITFNWKLERIEKGE